MSIAELCELRPQVEMIAEDIARVDPSVAAGDFMAATRRWGAALDLYIERLKLRGAQINEG